MNSSCEPFLRSVSSVSRSEWTSLYELSSRITYCWISFSISDQRLGSSGRSRQRGWRCIIGHTLLRMVRWCIRLTRLTLVCKVIRYRLVQVRQNLKKDFSGWRSAIAFLYLFLFHSLLRPTSFPRMFLSGYEYKLGKAYIWKYTHLLGADEIDPLCSHDDVTISRLRNTHGQRNAQGQQNTIVSMAHKTSWKEQREDREDHSGLTLNRRSYFLHTAANSTRSRFAARGRRKRRGCHQDQKETIATDIDNLVSYVLFY